jgi:hypothetical protein
MVCVSWAAEADAHRPTCSDARCQKVKAFIKAHYCGASPFGNGPEDGCEILQVKAKEAALGVISHFECEWREENDTQVSGCRQNGKVPPRVHASLTRELRRIGLPAAEDARTFFTVWKPKASEWTLAEGFYNHRHGESGLTLCQVIVMIAPDSQMFVLREVPFQDTDADAPTVSTWSLLDMRDVDGDGLPDVVMQGDAYENHWHEAYSIRSGSPHMIFSGLGYYL